MINRAKEHQSFKGDDGRYGVEEMGAVLYEAEFEKVTADRIAELENSDRPPKDWEATKEILISEQLPI